MDGLAYSFHIGSDKNKKKSAKKIANNNQSKSTSLSNNAIQNATGLSKVNKHNLRKYDDNQELITTIYGSSDLYKDVQELYKNEFEETRLQYNEKQKRDDRKIENYFENISNNLTRDLACEIIIELGDMEFWKDKPKEYCYKMVNVFKEQISDLTKIVPEFKLANCTIHFDESSPHLHIVGVPVKDGYKNGMSKQVGKSLIFTKESLTNIQDKMRECCIKSFNKIYEVNYFLKGKEEGFNNDVNVKNMPYYKDMRIKELKREVKYCKNIITKQKEEITILKKQVNFLKHLWLGLRSFFLDKIVFKKDKTYEKVADELYENQLFTKEELSHIKYGSGISTNLFKEYKNKDLER